MGPPDDIISARQGLCLFWGFSSLVPHPFDSYIRPTVSSRGNWPPGLTDYWEKVSFGCKRSYCCLGIEEKYPLSLSNYFYDVCGAQENIENMSDDLATTLTLFHITECITWQRKTIRKLLIILSPNLYNMKNRTLRHTSTGLQLFCD